MEDPFLSQTQRIAKKITNDLQFFKMAPILSFENQNIFSIPNSRQNNTFREPLLLNRNVGMYNDRHPKHVPSLGDVSAVTNLFRCSMPIDFRKINLFDVPTDGNRSYFLRLQISKNPIVNGWLFHSPNSNIIFNEQSGSADNGNITFETGNDRNYVVFNNSEKYLIISSNAENSKKQSKKAAQPPQDFVTPLVNDISKNRKAFSFEFFARSCLCSFANTNFFPIINISTLAFFRHIVEDPQFLFIFSQLEKVTEKNEFHSWQEASGHFIKTIFPVMVHHYFESVKNLDFSNIFVDPLNSNNEKNKDNIVENNENNDNNNNSNKSSNCFIFLLIAYILEDDKKFANFLDSLLTVPNYSAIEKMDKLIYSFKKIEFSPLSQFYITTLSNEANRTFPESEANYLFTGRLLFRVIYEAFNNNKNATVLKERLEMISQICNLDEKISANDLNTFKKIINGAIIFKDPLFIKKASLTSQASVEALVNKVFSNPTNFQKVAQTFDFANVLEQYRQLVQ